MRISDWSSDVCSSDLQWRLRSGPPSPPPIRSIEIFNAPAPPWTPPRLCALMLRPSLRDSFMARYSAFSLLANAFTGNRRWERVWRSPAPTPAYDAVIVGGGGHGQIGRAACRERVCQSG